MSDDTSGLTTGEGLGSTPAPHGGLAAPSVRSEDLETLARNISNFIRGGYVGEAYLELDRAVHDLNLPAAAVERPGREDVKSDPSGDVGKHTPTPWLVAEFEGSRDPRRFSIIGPINSGSRLPFLHTPSVGFQMLREDAELAVTAVNSHAALVEALRPFAEALKGNWSHQSDDMVIEMGRQFDLRLRIKLGDLRRAHQALSSLSASDVSSS